MFGCNRRSHGVGYRALSAAVNDMNQSSSASTEVSCLLIMCTYHHHSLHLGQSVGGTRGRNTMRCRSADADTDTESINDSVTSYTVVPSAYHSVILLSTKQTTQAASRAAAEHPSFAANARQLTAVYWHARRRSLVIQ